MKKLNHWLRNYFGFSKTESNGFIVLVPLIFVIIFSPYVWRMSYSEKNKTNEEDQRKLDSLVSVLEKRIAYTKNEQQDLKHSFKKSYDNNYTDRKQKAKNFYNKAASNKKVYKSDFKTKPTLQPFDINLADTAQLKKIYGIGPVLSARIVKYRDILGGFSSKAQYKEVYGLKDEALRKLDSLSFIADNFTPKQVHLNDEQAFKLDDHPYISRKVAKAIDAYRFQHGKIDSLEVLYQIKIIDSATLQKVAPYLKF